MAIYWDRPNESDYRATFLGVEFCISKMPVLHSRDPQWVVFRDGELVHEIPAQHTATKAMHLIPGYLREAARQAERAVETARELLGESNPEVLQSFKDKAAQARTLYIFVEV